MSSAPPIEHRQHHLLPAPHSLESEMALLGSILIDPKQIGEALLILSGMDDFYSQKNAMVYHAMVAVFEEGNELDVITIKNWLQDRGELKQIGGSEYLMEMADTVASGVVALYYAKQVREYAHRRQLIETLSRGLQRAMRGDESASELADAVETEIYKLASTSETHEAQDLGSLLQAEYDRLEAADGQGMSGLETGFYDLDHLMGGFQRSDMIILAGRPSMGKTALGLGIAAHLACNKGEPVGIFSLEMSKSQLGQRLLCGHAGVDSGKVKRNQLSGEEFNRLSLSVGALHDAPLYIHDQAGLTIMQLRALARRMASKYQIKLLVIDYLQLMHATGYDSRREEVDAISRGIKALARELDIPVLALAQLNRSPEARADFKPRMSDLRESGALEQDADAILMLHREEYYHQGDETWITENYDKKGHTLLMLLKARNGPVGNVNLHFDALTTRFHSHAQRNPMNL